MRIMTGEEIRKLRRALGLTQQEFAAKLGVSFAAVNRWEKGRNAPQPDRLVRIHELEAEYVEKKQGSTDTRVMRESMPQLDFEGDPEAIKLVVDSFWLRNGHLFN